MRAKSISDFRKNIAADIDAVVTDFEPLIITRPAGKQPVVVMSLEEFEGWKETLHLNSTKANSRRLTQGEADFEAGKGIEAEWPE
ncbi:MULTISPECIES: type II toxin-antitoxin system Phd/YefM family antitoxin [Devosia]|uniref:Antitoxin n=2 Tax=Devosia TaxID=46913 RepID=A0A6M1SS40_9HYPH|nr:MULTISPECIES: type II toxin-antitoxin system prevent-host-death family antitoxin [Devosia]NGP19366.1 type II toxin-antitoxin system prevent-host-death family antitoxin [Devosia aurantiaca]QQR39549.1 type II toxin-antitoxin system prevent-host-death family antitoxin [Devosia rhizoryzae]